MALVTVNGVGLEADVPDMAAVGDLPIAQDTQAAHVWDDWGVAYRDVVILDAQNKPTAVYNLTVHDLSNPANYAELRRLILAAVR